MESSGTHPSAIARSIGTAVLTALVPLVFAQDPARLLAEGDSLLAAGKTKPALDRYDKAVKSGPSAATHTARARGWLAMDRIDRFLQDTEQALKLDSTFAEAHYLRGTLALRGDDPAKAAHFATRALAHADASDAPLRAKALALRGEARSELKELDGAIADLEQALAMVGQETRVMRVLARQYDAANRHADALALLEKLCELEPDDAGHWTNRGYELIMLGRHEEALPMLDRALAIEKGEPVALSNRAQALLELGREKEAWQEVERSLRSFPANPHALYTRALLRFRKGENAKACEDLATARALGGAPGVEELFGKRCPGTPGR